MSAQVGISEAIPTFAMYMDGKESHVKIETTLQELQYHKSKIPRVSLSAKLLCALTLW